MARQVRYGDMTIAVPDDASDEEVSAIIETKEQEARVSAQPGNQPGLLERGGRYLAEWGQGIKDAATQPVGGPTGIPLVDAAAGVADFAASAASDTVTAVPRLARMAFTGARGGKTDPTWLTREPVTPTGKAIQDTAGAVFKPVGDTLSATGLPPEAAAFGTELLGTAADVAGLGLAGRGIRHGTRAIRPDIQDPGGVPRPFGGDVERARRLDYRVTPSQVAAKAQLEAPIGDFGPSVPGTLREAFTGPDFHVRAIIDNQKRTNAFAAKELGLTELTTMGLQFAKNPHNAVFNEVAQSLPVLRSDGELLQAANALGAARRDNPLLRTTTAVEEVRDRLLNMESLPTQQALDAIRSYRQDASKLFKQAEMGGSGIGVLEAEQAAMAYRGAADALEAAIERQAGQLYPDLVPRMRDARTALAKIHNVEDAFDGTNVNPQTIAKLSERYPLSGYLGEIAAVARAFPDTMKVATGIDVPIQTQQGALNSISLAARRAVGRSQGPALLADPFQNRFGRADPTFDPRPAPQGAAGASPFAEFTPPDPSVPGGADVMPPGPVLGPEVGRMGAIGLADEFDTLPEAELRPGDLTAETPPMGGSLPAGLVDELTGGPDLPLEPATMGELDFTPTQLDQYPDPFPEAPAATGGIDLGDALQPPLTDAELLDLQLQTALPPGPDPRLGDVRPRPQPPDEPPAPTPVEPDVPPQGGSGGGLVDELTSEPLPPQNPDAPTRADGTVDLAEQQRRLEESSPRRSLKDLMAREDLEENTIAAREARAAGTAGPRGLADELTLEDSAPRAVDELSAADLAGQMADMRSRKPRPLSKLYGEKGPTPEQAAEHARQMREWNREYSRLSKAQKAALERDNAAFNGRQQERGLADELTVENPAPRKGATDLADDGLKIENLPEQRAGDVGIKRTKRPPADMIPRKPLPPNPVVYYSGPARNPSRWIVMEEQGDNWILRSIDSTAFKKANKDHTRPPGREMLVLVAKDAQEMGKRFDSDTDMTVEIVDAIDRAVSEGALEIDDWDNAIAAARAALEASGGKRISRGANGGEPWFKNIRPGPTS